MLPRLKSFAGRSSGDKYNISRPGVSGGQSGRNRNTYQQHKDHPSKGATSRLDRDIERTESTERIRGHDVPLEIWHRTDLTISTNKSVSDEKDSTVTIEPIGKPQRKRSDDLSSNSDDKSVDGMGVSTVIR
jgi:hypothetical protein